jgi:hypothetical protein
MLREYCHPCVKSLNDEKFDLIMNKNNFINIHISCVKKAKNPKYTFWKITDMDIGNLYNEYKYEILHKKGILIYCKSDYGMIHELYDYISENDIVLINKKKKTKKKKK